MVYVFGKERRKVCVTYHLMSVSRSEYWVRILIESIILLKRAFLQCLVLLYEDIAFELTPLVEKTTI